jgi:hypothetical protein
MKLRQDGHFGLMWLGTSVERRGHEGPTQGNPVD